MSPIGGIGINLAVQDAVASANLLAQAFGEAAVPAERLAAVQHRRELPTKFTQGLQVAIQNRVIAPVLANPQPLRPPWFVPIMESATRRLRSRFIGIGFRPEHIKTLDVKVQPR
jgi:hypothetical protein